MDLGKAIEDKKREIECAARMLDTRCENMEAFVCFQSALDSLFELIPDMTGRCEYGHILKDCGLNCETECPYTSGERGTKNEARIFRIMGAAQRDF